jgi:hypothetical protein
MKLTRLDTVYEALSLKMFLGFREKHFVHTEGVTGSIPVTPTIPSHCIACVFLPFRATFAKCSRGLSKPHRRARKAGVRILEVIE